MIRYEDVDAYVAARDQVVRMAEDHIRRWEKWAEETGVPLDTSKMRPTSRGLYRAVLALRSLYADRGLRDPGTPGEQEPDAEQEHGQAVHPGGQS